MERYEEIIHELTEWIEKNIDKPLRIDEVAERAGYSKWHLQRIFHRVMHISMGNYIRDKKLQLAARDLIESEESVLHICMKYGYDSQQTFTRTFVRKYHVPPATFRRMSHHPAISFQTSEITDRHF